MFYANRDATLCDMISMASTCYRQLHATCARHITPSRRAFIRCCKHGGGAASRALRSASRRRLPLRNTCHILRKLLIQGARALLRVVGRHDDRQSRWVRQLLKRRHKHIVAVALANKLARTIWALLVKGEAFEMAR